MAEEGETETETRTDPPEHETARETPPEADAGRAELSSRVDTLSTQVGELTATVQGLLQKGEQDSTPVRRPWTHAGGR